MSNRLSVFLSRVAGRANRQQVDRNSQGDAIAVMVQSNELAASPYASVVEGSAHTFDVQAEPPVTSKSEVAEVAHILLPVQSEERAAATFTPFALFNDGSPQVVESATCATDAAMGCASGDLEVDIQEISSVARIKTFITSLKGEERASTEFQALLEWTHVTAKCVSLVDIETGHATEIAAATQVVILRSITVARRLGVINATDFALQLLMWQAICRGYLLVCVERQIFLANPVYQHQQFQPYLPSSKD